MHISKEVKNSKHMHTVNMHNIAIFRGVKI